MASFGAVQRDIDNLVQLFRKVPTVWDGRQAIKQMRSEGSSHWKQMEWIGFYGEFLVNRLLADAPEISTPGERYGNVVFDLKGAINWDLKVHPNTTGALMLNDREAVSASIDRHDYHGFIVMGVDCTYDDSSASFKIWHDAYKGGISNYEKDRLTRKAPSRRRKVSAKLTSVHFFVVNDESIHRLGSAQKGMRNSNGNPRREKFALSHRALAEGSERVMFCED